MICNKKILEKLFNDGWIHNYTDDGWVFTEDAGWIPAEDIIEYIVGLACTSKEDASLEEEGAEAGTLF